MSTPIELTVTVRGQTLTVHYFEGYAGSFGGAPASWAPPEPPEVEVVEPAGFDLEGEELYDAVVAACQEPLQEMYAAWAEGEAAELAALDAAAAEWEAMA